MQRHPCEAPSNTVQSGAVSEGASAFFVAVVGEVISFASGVDGWSLDISIPRPVHPVG